MRNRRGFSFYKIFYEFPVSPFHTFFKFYFELKICKTESALVRFATCRRFIGVNLKTPSLAVCCNNVLTLVMIKEQFPNFHNFKTCQDTVCFDAWEGGILFLSTKSKKAKSKTKFKYYQHA